MIGIEVIDRPAALVAQQRILALAHRQLAHIVGQRLVQKPLRARPRYQDLAWQGLDFPKDKFQALMEVTRAGGAIGIPGLYVTGDPGGVDDNAKIGNLGIRIGLGWAKSHNFTTGQCPVLRYNRQLMMAILHDKVQIAKAVNATVIPLDQAPQGYKDFDKGAAKKFVLDPHGTVAKAK